MENELTILEDSVRDSYAGVVWSHKIQEKQADIYATRYHWMEVANIFFASLTSAGVISLIFIDPLWLKIVSAVLSFITIFITAYLNSFDLPKLISSHKTTANRLISVRDRHRVLLTKIKLASDSKESILGAFDQLVKDTDNIYSEAPNTTNWAVKKAGKALKVKQDNSFSDEEIDSFLPRSLRRKIDG